MEIRSPETSPFSRADQLAYAREVLELEGRALFTLSSRLNATFCQAVELVHAASGAVIVTGMGKAGWIGRKLAATFSSTGTPSHFLHPAEAVHGDLGRIQSGDIVLVLSQSGETEEIVRILPLLGELADSIVAITNSAASSLGRAATVVLELGSIREACMWGLAPTTSTTAMIALGDALALVCSRMKGFVPQDFARFHPAGALGMRLRRVEEQMRPLCECRVAHESRTVRDVFVSQGRPGRRTGALMLVDDDGRLSGIFTDSDLARLFELRRDSAVDRPIREVMTPRPATCRRGMLLADAVEVLAGRKISELPVLDESGRPLGMIDITDLARTFGDSSPGKANEAIMESNGARTLPLPALEDQPARRAS